MPAHKIKPNIYFVGTIDWDRRSFDELIPLPQGTTYNSYLIRGNKKTILIDTVDPSKWHELIDNLKVLQVKNIDYIIANHAEQDHSGALPYVLGDYPSAKIITNFKCKDFLQALLHIPDNRFITVKDGDTIAVGGKTFEFIFTPWAHWPDTMLTYLREDKILFTCDLFGSHIATSELYAENVPNIYEAAKRYYAEIMMPFRINIRNHVKRIEGLNIKLIAPSHGPIYRQPSFILDAYKVWISNNVKNEVIIAFVSMHGSTRKMVEYLVDSLIKRDITVKPFNLTKTDIGELAMALVDAATIVIASPTVLVGAHPTVVHATYLINTLRPKAKFAAIIGSYGWSGRMADQIKDILSGLRLEILDPIIVRGLPKQDDFKALDKLADEIKKKHRELGVIDKVI